MIPSEREHILRELSEVDRSNLKLARVTRQALWEAARRIGLTLGAEPLLRLADELNDMLEAAGGPRCWACGATADAPESDGGARYWCRKCAKELRGKKETRNV